MRRLDLSTFPVSWEVRPALTTLDQALSAEAERVHGRRPGNILTSGRVARGDVAAGLAASDFVVEGAFETGFVEHAYIEPEAGFARRVGDRIEIQACTQAPYMDRDDVAKILGIAPTQVRIIPTAVGGGFGSKLDLSVQPFIALAAWRLDRPVRMVYSRPESIMTTTKRHPARIRAKVGATRDGRLTAMDFSADFNTGAYASWGPTVANRVPVHASGPYRMPHYRAVARAVHTHLVPSGAFRGFGVPQSRARAGAAVRRTRRAARPRQARVSHSQCVGGGRRHGHRPGLRRRHGFQGVPRGAATALARGARGRRFFQRRRRGAAAARRRRRRHVVRLRQHLALQSVDDAARPEARRKVRAVPGRGRHRAGLQHRHPADLRRSARRADRAAGPRLGGHRRDARLRQDLRLAPDLRLRQRGCPGRASDARRDPAIGERGRGGEDWLRARRGDHHGRGRRTADRSVEIAGRRRGLRRGGRRDLRSADYAARRERPGRALRGVRVGRAYRRGRGRYRARPRQSPAAHMRARRRPSDQSDAGRRPDRGRRRAGARSRADGGVLPRQGREPARLSHPDHRRHAAGRVHPDRGRVLRRPVRRQGHRRTGADSDRAGDLQRDPSCNRRPHPPRARRRRTACAQAILAVSK